MNQPVTELDELIAMMFQAHPWHGVPTRLENGQLQAYIEIVPTDAVKYELDKRSGHLRVDRPQRFSSFPPTLYGFVPQTFCGDRVAELCRRAGVEDSEAIRGDGDPMDICVLTERPAAHADFLVRARPVGGLRMIDGSEADDKIIAVMENDVAYGYIEDISQAPRGLVERLQHYFLTYKQLPQESPRRVEIADVYDREAALETIRRSIEDYRALYGAPESRVDELRRMLSDAG